MSVCCFDMKRPCFLILSYLVSAKCALPFLETEPLSPTPYGKVTSAESHVLGTVQLTGGKARWAEMLACRSAGPNPPCHWSFWWPQDGPATFASGWPKLLPLYFQTAVSLCHLQASSINSRSVKDFRNAVIPTPATLCLSSNDLDRQ